MPHTRYISIISISGSLAWLGFFLVVTKLSPYESMGLALSFFFVTFFIALSCTFAVFGFYFRLWLLRNEIYYRHISIALRQGIFLALIAVFCLIFLMLNVLSWWSGLFLVFASVLLEFYFSSRDSELLG